MPGDLFGLFFKIWEAAKRELLLDGIYEKD